MKYLFETPQLNKIGIVDEIETELAREEVIKTYAESQFFGWIDDQKYEIVVKEILLKGKQEPYAHVFLREKDNIKERRALCERNVLDRIYTKVYIFDFPK